MQVSKRAFSPLHRLRSAVTCLSMRTMILRVQWLVLLLVWSTAWAGNGALPASVQAALRQANIPASHVGVEGWEVG